MDMEFMRKLELLRVEWGLPLIPTSAARCRHHNERVGGALRSQHLLGKAADFCFPKKSSLLEFVELAEKFGFNGIGVGKIMVHIDNRLRPARWGY